MKTLFYCTLILWFCFSNNLFAETYWVRIFGGAYTDIGNDVQQTTDNGFIITGYTWSGSGKGDVWLIKTDILGNKQWERTFGDGSSVDEGKSIQQTTDGGYIITGYTSSIGSSNSDIWLIKTDDLGLKQWDQTFGGTEEDYGESIQQTTDGGYIIVGWTLSYGAGYYDLWLIKTDPSGIMQWDYIYGGSSNDYGKSVQQTSDGGYIVTGTTESFGAGSNDVCLIKTDSMGIKQWEQTLGGSDADGGTSVKQTSDGGYIITGYTNSYGSGYYDVWLIKTDASGKKLWDKTFSNGKDIGFLIDICNDYGYFITGYTNTNNLNKEDLDVWLIKTDLLGNMQWNETFGGIFQEISFSGLQTRDSGYIITGYTYSFGAGECDVLLSYYKPDNQPPYPPTLLHPLDGSAVNAPLVELKWINNGDPDNDPVGSWLYMVGAWGQVISYDMGAEGFTVGEELSFSLILFPGQEWAWTVYIYDPNLNSDPYYSFQEPFWTFNVTD